MGEVTPGQVKGIGLCAPGPLNIKTGEVMHAPNLKWKNVQIVGILEKEFGLPVILENDANAAGYGECIYGAGKGAVNMLYMTVSTGIGELSPTASWCTEGLLCLSEVGHMIVLPGGPLCGCGQHGCIEALASGTAIARTARKRLEDGEQSIISDLVKGDINTVTSREVAEAARQGDQLAVSLLDEAFFYLGIAIGNLINILNPETIVIGGGVAKMGDLLFDRVSRVLQDHAFPHMVKGVSIVPAVLAGRAGTMGMVALVRKRLNS